MKKVVIGLITIAVFCFVLILISNFNHKKGLNLDELKTSLTINYNIDKINDIYRFEDIYMVDYEKGGSSYYGVSNTGQKLTKSVLKTEVLPYERLELSNTKYNLGYKYDTFVYEIKNDKKNELTYSYYNALDGSHIKDIKAKK